MNVDSLLFFAVRVSALKSADTTTPRLMNQRPSPVVHMYHQSE